MSELLFIYGTLRPDRAPTEIADAAWRLRWLGAGTIRGRRYELGSYPGLVLSEDKTEAVRGEVFEVPDAETLARLDAYEDFRVDDPDGSLFLRTKAVVTLDNGSEESCWVYVYNRDVG
jgi:gamma-glutamylcyclotransferase (GGCT)/AIG2-like uncharacterized protein YtfP